jgi:hypothetical protein
MVNLTRSTLKLFCIVLLVLNISLFFSDIPSWQCSECTQTPYAIREHGQFYTEPFQTDNTGCSVRVIADEKIFSDYMKNKGTVPFCTMDYFKQYLHDHQQFVGEGVWFAPPNGTPSVEADFYPDGCTFSRKLSNAAALTSCFRQKMVKRILVTGDSNSAFMKSTLRDYLEELTSSTACSQLAVAINNPAYFLVPDIDNGTLNSDIDGSAKIRCMLQNNDDVILERIAMKHILDRSIYIKKIDRKGDFLQRVFHAETKLEYLLKYYFPHVGFPDLWLFTLPFHHESWGSSVDKIRADLIYMLKMFDMHLPKKTRVVFIADARECPELRPTQVIIDFEAFWNKTRNVNIHELNQVLYEVLWRRSKYHINVFGFLDADKISCPLVCKWHFDGAHMTRVWYEKMVRYVLESFCAEVPV